MPGGAGRPPLAAMGETQPSRLRQFGSAVLLAVDSYVADSRRASMESALMNPLLVSACPPAWSARPGDVDFGNAEEHIPRLRTGLYSKLFSTSFEIPTSLMGGNTAPE
ncbi:hypothetical protein VTO42DRAFT_194 [Malbranchea cinnamomea]